MSDPKRWLDEPPLDSPLAEQLIVAGRELELSPRTVERSWAEFSAKVAAGAAVVTHAADAAGAAGGGAGAVGGGAGAAGLSSGAVVKSFVVGALLGVGAASAVPAVRYVTSSTGKVKTVASATGVPAGSSRNASGSRRVEHGEQPVLHGEPAGGMDSAPIGASSGGRSAPSASLAPDPPVSVVPGSPEGGVAEAAAAADANRLKLEALGLAKAKNLLESGDTRGALDVLQQTRARFAGGAMVEERDALVIEALARRGDVELARAAARRFIVRFPKSPLAERVKRTSGLE